MTNKRLVAYKKVKTFRLPTIEPVDDMAVQTQLSIFGANLPHTAPNCQGLVDGGSQYVLTYYEPGKIPVEVVVRPAEAWGDEWTHNTRDVFEQGESMMAYTLKCEAIVPWDIFREFEETVQWLFETIAQNIMPKE